MRDVHHPPHFIYSGEITIKWPPEPPVKPKTMRVKKPPGGSGEAAVRGGHSRTPVIGK